MRKPFTIRSGQSPAVAISLVALVIAMSGTAYAATGSTFLVGGSNTASTISSLRNTKGTALALTSAPKHAPLTVSNSVQVPKLNVSELGGIPAGGFVQGDGAADSGAVGITGPGEGLLASSTTSSMTGVCDASSTTGAEMEVSLTESGSIVWWNKDGTADTDSGFAQVTPETSDDFVVVVQVTQGGTISTYTASQTYENGTCSFSAQLVVTGL